jgi:hypothetical protein
MILVGIGLRLGRFGLNYPLWGDEACLAANLIDRSYSQLLAPLQFGQVCPPAFLAIELAMTRWLGFREWVLRLFPLGCAVASVPIFGWMAGMLLSAKSRLLAVSIFAVSLHPLRHGAEVKPYASDLLGALILITLAAGWLRSRADNRWLWCLLIITPFTLAISFPATFVAAGVGLALAWPAWRTRRSSSRLAFGLYLVTVLVTFGVNYVLSLSAQDRWTMLGLREYWKASFPPLTNPLDLPRWFLSMHTGTMMAYPGGGKNGGSTATFALLIIAVIFLYRRRERSILILLLAPFALTMIAAAVKRYPYGGEARQMQFVAPAICVLAGLGSGVLLERIRRPRSHDCVLAIVVIALIIDPVVALSRDASHPYRFNQDHELREMARQFWPAAVRQGATACVTRDIGVCPRGGNPMRLSAYLCNARIYSPIWHPPGHISWVSIDERHPLRCVLGDSALMRNPAIQDWLESMTKQWTLVRTDVFVPVPLGPKAATPAWLVFEFVPRTDRTGPIAVGSENVAR